MAFSRQTVTTIAKRTALGLSLKMNEDQTPSEDLLQAARLAGIELWMVYNWKFREDDTTSPPNILYSEDPWTDSSSPLDDTTSPGWPVAFDVGWLYLSHAYASETHDSTDKAGYWRAIYEKWLGNRIEQDGILEEGETADESDPTTIDDIADLIRIGLDIDPTNENMKVIRALVKRAAIELWHSEDWRFRVKTGSITTSSGTSEYSVPSDFSEISVRKLWQEDTLIPLRVTENVDEYNTLRERYTSNGYPSLALLARDTDTSASWAWEFNLTPTPDGAYTYNFIYVINDPWSLGTVADSASPIWPQTFYDGWILLAKWRVSEFFGKSTYARDSESSYRRWHGDQLQENNETVTTGAMEFIAGRNDDISLLASQTAFGFSEGVVQWPT